MKQLTSPKVVALPVRRQVENLMREAIVSGRFKAGEHLPDRMLCETFGASRSVVREAARLLEAEGLIKVHPHRGQFVAELSSAEATQIYELRAALEALAGEGFAVRASEAERAELKAVYRDLIETPPDVEQDRLLDLKRKFYEILTTGSRNAYLASMLAPLLNRNSQLRATSLSSPGRLSQTVAELGEIIAAIDQRDAAGTAAACRAHITNAATIALRIIREREAKARAWSSPMDFAAYND